MSKAIPYLIQGKNIILVIDSKSHTISKDTHISYGKIVDALKAQDWDALRDLANWTWRRSARLLMRATIS